MDGEPAQNADSTAPPPSASSATDSGTSSASLRMHQRRSPHRDRVHVGNHSERGHLGSTAESPAASATRSAVTGTCWCISKGMAGMNSQTGGMAHAVGYRPAEETASESLHDEGAYRFKTTRLKLPWNALPIGMVPATNSVLKDPDALDEAPQPRLVVSCGRQGVIPAVYLKKKLGDRVFTVHIQDPKCDPSGFDLVLVPEHDPTRGPNVYVTMGALHKVTPERLEEARHSELAGQLADPDRQLVTVLLGGKNGCYRFSRADIDRLFNKLHSLVSGNDVKLAVLTSNRTPAEVAERLNREFSDRHLVWNGSGPNPYFEALALADYLVVTGDSVSMTSEAVSTGRPVFIEHLTERRRARRFRRFHAMFEEAGFTRRFEGRLEDWSYDPPEDMARVVQLIKERMQEQ